MKIIDADKLMEYFRYPIDYTDSYVKRMINAQPTVDATQVIKCKDCKHWYDVNNGEGHCDELYNFFHGDDIATSMRSYANDFCYYGESR